MANQKSYLEFRLQKVSPKLKKKHNLRKKGKIVFGVLEVNWITQGNSKEKLALTIGDLSTFTQFKMMTEKEKVDKSLYGKWQNIGNYAEKTKSGKTTQ